MTAPAQVINQGKSPEGPQASNLQYPANLANYSYFMALHFVKYDRFAGQNFSSQTTPVGNIYLPLPLNIAEEFGIGYTQTGDTFANIIQTIAASGQSFKDMLYGDGDVNWNNITGLLSGDRDTIRNIGPKALKAAALGAMLITPDFLEDATSVGAAVKEAAGFVQNPHMTMLFEGVELRKHSFSWLFSPRSQAESQALDHIIINLRQWIHPKFNETFGRYALDFPYQVFCNFIGTNFLYPVKRAVVTGMSIDNAADGNVSFYGGGAPVNIKLTLNLQECEILTRDDFVGEAANAYTSDGSYSGANSAPGVATAGDGSGRAAGPV
jgi:hypothetical protein